MVILYEYTSYFSIALFAIVITVFVLAVSLLGRAVRMSLEERQKTEKERKEQYQDELERIQHNLDDAKSDDKVIDTEGLTESIHNLKNEIKRHNRQLVWIQWKPKLLRSNWGVFIPSALFLFSTIFSVLALRFQTFYSISLTLWILSIITLFFGITLICLILKVIEGVAITSEEVSFARQKEMMVAASREIDEEKKPLLELKLMEIPFTINADSTKKMRCELNIARGGIARKTIVNFFIPKEFYFPGKPSFLQDEKVRNVSGLRTAQVGIGDCLPGYTYGVEIDVKAPTKKDTYDFWYKLGCELYTSPENKFEIKVD